MDCKDLATATSKEPTSKQLNQQGDVDAAEHLLDASVGAPMTAFGLSQTNQQQLQKGLISPYIGWSSLQARHRLVQTLAEHLQSYVIVSRDWL